MSKTVENWVCSCGFPYNKMSDNHCGDCSKARQDDCEVAEHTVVGIAYAESATMDKL